MAHYAEIVDGLVVRVTVVNNAVIMVHGLENGAIGAEFCHDLIGGEWVQCSYHGNIRFNYPGIGYTYDVGRDAFIAPQPYASWLLDEATCRWVAPIPMPTDGGRWVWDENFLNWVELVR